MNKKNKIILRFFFIGIFVGFMIFWRLSAIDMKNVKGHNIWIVSFFWGLAFMMLPVPTFYMKKPKS